MKELQEAMEAKFAELKKQVEEKTSGVSNEEFEALQKKHNDFVLEVQEAKEKGVKAESIDVMQKHLDALDIKMQKIDKIKTAAKSFSDEIFEQLTKNKGGLDTLAKNQSAAVNIEVKAVGDLLFGDFTGTGTSKYNGHAYTTDVDRVLGKAGNCPNVLQQVVNRGTTTGNRVVYVDMYSEGDAGMTAEGAKKTQVGVNFEEKTADVKKITAFIKVSKEMLDDLDFLRAEINNELRQKIEDKLEEQIYSGTGLTVNLSGITSYISTTFTGAGGSYAAKVPFANSLDAIRIAIADIAADCFTPNLVLLNPADLALMDLNKTEGGAYLMAPFATASGQNIAGVRVMGSSEIPVGDFLIGDFSKANLRVREGISINIGYENDDFTKNMVTILAEMRAVFYIKEQHKAAFRRGTLATVIGNITEVAG